MDWSYIAGYFDGEGSVSCHLTKRGDRTRGMTWYNTHEGSLLAMREFMGCGIIDRRAPRAHQNHVACALRISRKVQLLRVLDGMLPHLIVKREAAEELKRFLIEEVKEGRYLNHGKVAAVPTEQLREWHVVERWTISKIAQHLGVGVSAVWFTFQRRGIPVDRVSTRGRPKSAETRARMKASWQDPEIRASRMGKRVLNRAHETEPLMKLPTDGDA